MIRLEAALARVDRELSKLGVQWALVGGMALGVRAEPRTTRDIDLVVAVKDDKEAERIVHLLSHTGFSLALPLEQTDKHRLATVRLMLRSPDDQTGVLVDLLLASSGIEAEIVAAAERFEIIPGVFMPVARTGHLMALKALAGRAQDLADFGALVKVADEVEIARARSAARLIVERSFARGKALESELEKLLEK